LADPAGKAWPDSYLRDLIYDFGLWSADLRPELFVSEQLLELSANGAATSCCIRIESIEAEVDENGNIIEQLAGTSNASVNKVPYARRMCEGGRGTVRRRYDVVGVARNTIRAVPALRGAEKVRLRVRCVARPKMAEDFIEIPALLEPYLYEYVVARAMGNATDSQAERAAAAERLAALRNDIIRGRTAHAQMAMRKPKE
jgi:hypothetical protein